VIDIDATCNFKSMNVAQVFISMKGRLSVMITFSITITVNDHSLKLFYGIH